MLDGSARLLIGDSMKENLVASKAKPGPKAAMFNTIITQANRYIPIINPIPACKANTPTNQISRVFRGQMKTG